MKLFIFTGLFLIVLLLFASSDIREIRDQDLVASLSEHPELYDYYDFNFTDMKVTEYKERTEVEFAYDYTRQAKTHIAIIDGEYLSVDNAFINSCLEYRAPLHLERMDPCTFITEMGTVEHLHGDHAYLTVERWGRFSMHSIQQALRSEKMFDFLSRFIGLLQDNDQDTVSKR